MNEAVFTDQNFKTEVLDAKQPVLVDLWAEWCGPCRMLAPVVEKIADDYAGKIKVGKLNIDDNPETPTQYGVQGIPTILIFKNGELVKRLVGYQPEDRIKGEIDTVL
ncbi:MAG: thioredoxin [Candidatus Omnitrophica bacterium CG11_big_fil_rev_8_21_14_0_20_45_26]|uniref:Thioredoxin n=1 Tax=Candidatus Abzuiibacterium crystallinum TaxID=1974748 RepID=A0A2H0LNM4_9BACT|nr:MAG: thioredoxin [Candidatus Omnitrophica bacterium CG11_big_fil_rev_8_21_14_0_20_45_26]PIW63828.1 MAG: thioredoxin [Candidatus Omnitrophica bacterium CG12_big_fil_rev_8_21_14_0_65_45_16]